MGGPLSAFNSFCLLNNTIFTLHILRRSFPFRDRMNQHNPPTVGTASYDALAALLGVKGPLRLLPQGSAPKPHVVLKRDYSRDDGEGGEATTKIARFSFIAGKKFSISKGQPLLFAIACPTDQDGKTLLSDDNTFLLEGDLANDIEGSDEEGADQSEAGTKGRANIEGLPPKMRKSYTRKKAYASFVENEPHTSLGFDGYPLNAPTPRVFSSASVQTDPAPSPAPHEISRTPQIPLSTIEDTDKSPVQLPSPVSADHAREVITDGLGEETDYYSRYERSRSLSPMELSSGSCSPASSPVALPAAPPERPAAPLFHDLLSAHSATSTASVTQTIEDRVADPSSHLPAPSSTSTSAAVGVTPIPQVPDQASSELPLITTPPANTDSKAKGRSVKVKLDSELAANGVESWQELALKKELIEAAEWAHSVQNVVASVQHLAHARQAENIPSGPRAMTQMPRVVPQPNGKPQEPSSANLSTKLSLSAPTFVKSTQSSIKSTWDVSPPAAVPYIPASTTSNPLGIRPSSSSHLAQKSLPKGPRSLVGTTSTPPPPKKPVVVGAKWTAARSSGPNMTNMSNGGLSASSSSSSLSSIPSSATPPLSTVKAGLSQILRYTSPSPPPPPESDPPPPLPPQPSVAKWKRISSIGEVTSNAAPKPTVAVRELIAQVEINNLKRPLDSTTKASDDKQKSNTIEEQPAKKAKTTDFTTTTAPTPTTSTSIAATAEKTSATPTTIAPPAKVQLPQTTPSSTSKSAPTAQKVPQPLTHPLPPKPVATGSSYRPSLKRDRSPDISSAKRPAPRTDWPATSPVADYRLQIGAAGVEPGVQKILFNEDGTQVALICADRTLRIWDNKPPAAAEVARLSHNSAIASACWIDGNAGVMTMGADGMICTWTRGVGNEWKFTKLLTVPEVPSTEVPFCIAYVKDRIAVSMPSGVKVWLLISGTWQQQREIARSGVTAIKFVQDGNALIGGCRDGVMWYCEVPNGTLRVHAFLSQKPIISIDIHPTGLYLLVAQEGGKAHLVTMKPNENKGNIERTYTSEKIQSMSMTQKGFPAIFATKGQAVLYGTVNGCALVWDRKKGMIVYGLKHPEGDPVQAAATFDGRPGVEGWMITGTKEGRLFWWPQPVAAAPSHSASSAGTPDDSQRKRQKVAS
ncbi:hypothetical protein BDZ97DRAFT_1916158 [Flammula alnicola]|nr:hypothetical protein BDZ97DRAFT_1916158 [Flammula alnicola]